MNSIICTNIDDNSLYYLAWLDCLERLDILLLEARHVQQNLIYNLREPILYRVLRYEEKFLWEKNFYRFFTLCKKKNIENFVQLAIIDYPDKFISPSTNRYKDIDSSTINYASADKIFYDISWRVNNLLSKNFWNEEQRRNYYSLQAIQILKKSILRDKAILCFEGCKVFIQTPQHKEAYFLPKELSKFLILRRGILEKVRLYVTRLADHQEQFSKSQDVSILDNPRPSLTRRREQSIYNTYLTSRCLQIFKEMQIFLENFGYSIDYGEIINISHRWQHDTSSEQSCFHDNLNVQKNKFLFFIKTSYWMPERPDLQSVITHEVAHAITAKYLGSLSTAFLEQQKDDFTQLLIEIYKILEFIDYPNPQGLLNEIAADIISTTVSGTSYLYSLFLEYIGFGLETLLTVSGEVNLDIIDYIDGTAGYLDHLPPSRDWYLRLHICCTWLKKISNEKREEHFSLRILKSIQKILDNLNHYLYEIAFEGAIKDDGWSKLKDTLTKIISGSNAIRIAQKHYKNCRNSYYYWDNKSKSFHGGNRDYPKFTAPLPIVFRNYLLMLIYTKKTTKGSTYESINKYFLETYQLEIVFERNDYTYSKIKCPKIFKYIKDIAWQCAFMRGIDSMAPLGIFNTDNNEKFIRYAHENSTKARELYHVALDFHLASIESNYSRLCEVSRLIEVISTKQVDIKIQKSLVNWLSEESNFYENMKGLKKILKKYTIFEILAGLKIDSFDLSLPPFLKEYRKKLNACKNDIDKIYLGNLYQAFQVNLKDTYILMVFISELKSVIKDTQETNPFKKFLSYSCLLNEVSLNISREVNFINIQKKIKSIRKIILKSNNDNLSFEISNKFSGKLADKYTAETLIYSFTKTGNYIERRIIERSLGKKIKNLLSIVESLVKNEEFNDSNSIQYLTILQNYTLMHSKNNYEQLYPILSKNDPKYKDLNFYTTILDSFMPSKTIQPRPINPLHLLGRMSTASAYIGIADSLYETDNAHQLLGRYDFFIIKKKPLPLGRNDLFRFGQSKVEPPKERFLPYFTRWEYALKIHFPLAKKCQSYSGDDNFCPQLKGFPKVFAMISITLNSNSSRLNFIYRLIMSSKQQTNTTSLDSVGLHLESHDYILLCDGWGDIVIVFCECPQKQRLLDIFEIQNELYQDFQVDRTEMFFTPKSINQAVLNSKNFSISFNLRVSEDRTLGTINNDTITAIKNNLDSEFEGKLIYEISKTPGVMDFLVTIQNVDEIKNHHRKNFYKTFLKCFGKDPNSGLTPKIDRIITSLSRKEA